MKKLLVLFIFTSFLLLSKNIFAQFEPIYTPFDFYPIIVDIKGGSWDLDDKIVPRDNNFKDFISRINYMMKEFQEVNYNNSSVRFECPKEIDPSDKKLKIYCPIDVIDTLTIFTGGHNAILRQIIENDLDDLEHRKEFVYIGVHSIYILYKFSV
ncbi:MAG: hypothetical protein MUF43_07560 [Flavobacterium sp.]|nr:hypothetical protein [Flavobacterium sp.]